MWFKKKSVLQADGHYNTEKSVDGEDLRITSKGYQNITTSGRPSAADAGNYFYLPALGYYASGQLADVGRSGTYWSSSANPWRNGNAYVIYFFDGYICTDYNGRHSGLRVGAFE